MAACLVNKHVEYSDSRDRLIRTITSSQALIVVIPLASAVGFLLGLNKVLTIHIYCIPAQVIACVLTK